MRSRDVIQMSEYRRKRSPRRSRRLRPLVLMGALASLGATYFLGTSSAQSGTVFACSVTDGDTIRCGDERIRLLGIDAPELPGHCRAGRDCAPGDSYASTASLSGAISYSMRITRVGTDHYGRTLALVEGPKGDLSCWQLAQGQSSTSPIGTTDFVLRKAARLQSFDAI